MEQARASDRRLRHSMRCGQAYGADVRNMSVGVLYRVGAPLSAVGPCAVAVAGTREPTPWGRRAARMIGRMLAEAGYATVTGLARGIDEEAALGALEAGGYTVAVLPYLLERCGKLSPRAAWLLRTAASYGAPASAVAENLVKDDSRVGMWLAARNKIIARIATALIVPEARLKQTRWGTRHAVERALEAGRLVVVLKPRSGGGGVAEAFSYFRHRGAVAAEDTDEALDMIKHRCRLPH